MKVKAYLIIYAYFTYLLWKKHLVFFGRNLEFQFIVCSYRTSSQQLLSKLSLRSCYFLHLRHVSKVKSSSFFSLVLVTFKAARTPFDHNHLFFYHCILNTYYLCTIFLSTMKNVFSDFVKWKQWWSERFPIIFRTLLRVCKQSSEIYTTQILGPMYTNWWSNWSKFKQALIKLT